MRPLISLISFKCPSSLVSLPGEFAVCLRIRLGGRGSPYGFAWLGVVIGPDPELELGLTNDRARGQALLAALSLGEKFQT